MFGEYVSGAYVANISKVKRRTSLETTPVFLLAYEEVQAPVVVPGAPGHECGHMVLLGVSSASESFRCSRDSDEMTCFPY